jgi:hypothetical protein
MKPDEIQKLLGGYATGTLTSEEQQTLFAAALEDQELFDALAKEQPLHDLLRDPAARAHVLASIDDHPRKWWQWANRWILAGTTVAALLVGAGVYMTRPKPAANRVLIADLQQEKTAPRPVMPPPQAEPVPAATPAASAPVVKQRAALRQLASTPPPADRRETAEAKAQSEELAAEQAAALKKVETAAPPPPPVPAPAPPAAAGGSVGSVLGFRAAEARPAPPKQPAGAATPRDAKDLNAVFDTTGAPNARALFYAAPGMSTASGFVPSSQNAGLQTPATIEQLPMQGRAVAGLGGVLPVPHLGVKWTALRKGADGLFNEVDPEQIRAGDTIKLRLVPNDYGYLSIFDGSVPLVLDQRTQRLQPFETAEITGKSGRKNLTVILSRNAQPAQLTIDGKPKQQTAPGLIPVAAASGDQLSESDRGEHAVYEVKSGANAFAPVLVKITLNFR